MTSAVLAKGDVTIDQRGLGKLLAATGADERTST
jgi:hypothetical protein